MLKDTTLGFRPTATSADVESNRQYDRMKDKVLEQLKTQFRPEFLNRVDSFVVFRSLNVEEIREIVDLLLARVREQLRIQQIDLEIARKPRTTSSRWATTSTTGRGPCDASSRRWSKTRSRRRCSWARTSRARPSWSTGRPDAGLTIEAVAEKTPVEAL